MGFAPSERGLANLQCFLASNPTIVGCAYDFSDFNENPLSLFMCNVLAVDLPSA